jgi:hypothetical protein
VGTTNFGLLFHLRGRLSNAHGHQEFFEPSKGTKLGDKTISPAASFVQGIHFTNQIFGDSRCPFGQIDNRKQILGSLDRVFRKFVVV